MCRDSHVMIALIAILAFISSAVADSNASTTGGQLEEITVTARKVQERLQSVPASISVLSATDLAVTGSDSFDQVIPHLPNVSMSGGIAGVLQGQLGIRGVSTLVRNIGVESGVGIYVDGVYMGRSDNYNQELIDIGQIEVLRGPQGTLFGKNTIAGVFNITTLQPGTEVSGAAKIEAGDYSLARAQAYLMGPIADGVLSAKLVGGYLSRDGVYKNLAGGPNGDRLDLDSFRAELYYTPTTDAKWVLSLDGLRDRGNPAFFQVTDLKGLVTPMATTPHIIDPNRPDSLHRDNYGASLTGIVNFGPTGTFTSISAFRHSSYLANLDDDQAQVDLLAVDRWGDITKFFTQEFRFSQKLNDQFNYVAGLYYFNQKITTDRLLALGSTLTSAFGLPGQPGLSTQGSVNAQTYAGFGNATYQFDAHTALSFGLRYSSEHKDANFVQGDPTGIFAFLGLPGLAYSQSTSNRDLSPTVSLSYQFTPDVLAYARIAKGFKSASFNVDLVSSTKGLAAGPEHATTYEIGVKSDLWDRRVRANVAIFDTRYQDMQVSQLLGNSVFLNNAGKSTIKGYEIELTGFVTRNFKLQGSMGYLDPKYDQYANCGIPASLGGGFTDCSGKQIIGAAKYTFATAAEFDQPTPWGKFVARVDYSVQSPVFFEATNSQRFGSDWRHVADARVGLMGRWDVFVWGKNLTNATYVTYHDDRSTIGVLQTTAYGDPRTWGVTLGTHF